MTLYILYMDQPFDSDGSVCKKNICSTVSHIHINIILPYPRKRGPMGGAPYIGPRLGDGPIFEVSVSRLYAKERPGKLPMLAS